MAPGTLRLALLIAGRALHAAALAAPAIHFKQDPRSNPKRSERGVAVKEDVDGIPFNESSTGPDNLNVVDHLRLGFYLWMASLLVFAAYCFQRR